MEHITINQSVKPSEASGILNSLATSELCSLICW
jgi:hypothetical protein